MNSRTIIEGEENVGDTLHYRERVRQLPGRLEFQAVLGKGAHGAALLVAPKDDPAAAVVIKMLRHERLAETSLVHRFRRELATHLRLSQTLQVPRVVRCLGFHDDRYPARIHGRFSYYRHGSLADFVVAGATIDAALRVLLDAIEGLQALHGHRYLHRDVCPANIFVGDEAGVARGVLGDLGVGLFLEPNTLITEDEVITERALRVGHAGFIDAALAATEQGDLHGIGATLYWILSGQPSVPAPEPGGLVLPSPDICRPGLGEGLHAAACRVLQRLTCADGKQRYSNAMEARAAVAQLIGAVRVVAAQPAPRPVVAARPAPRPAVAAPPIPRSAVAARPAPRPAVQSSDRGRRVRRQRRGHPALRPVLAAAVILVAILTGSPALQHWMRRSSGPITEFLFATLDAPRFVQADSPGMRQGGDQEPERAAAAKPEVREIDRLLALAIKAKPGADPATMERQLWSTVDAQPFRGELRLALARVLVARGRKDDATGVLAAAPRTTTYRDEIRQLHQFLAGVGRPSD